MGAPEGNQYALGNPGGGVSKYDPNYHNDMAFKYALLGLTDKRIAFLFGIDEVTLNVWKEKHKEFNKSLNAGKEEADAEVVKSLYKRATGYDFEETTKEEVNGALVDKKVVQKHVPADVGAQTLWLKNRRRKNRIDEGAMHWSDKQETGFTDNEGEDLGALPIKFE